MSGSQDPLSVLTTDADEVFKFVTEFVPLTRSPSQTAIGLKREGQVVAGVIYDDYNKSNVWMHVAAVPGKRWLNRAFLTAAFWYPFCQLKVGRITGWVEASNEQARRFNEHLGFVPEAVLSGAAQDGGEVIIYRMRREECKYV